MTKRYEWVDTLKFLGIWAIFLGHMPNDAGMLYLFVFKYHVPLFFFVSGFFADNMAARGGIEVIKGKIKSLMIPYLCFGVLSCVYFILYYTYFHCMSGEIMGMLLHSLWGIRIKMDFFGSIWFISCLFFMEIGWYFVSKLLKSKWKMLVLSCVLFYLTRRYGWNSSGLIFSIDWVLYYAVYYAIGSCVFDWLKEGKISGKMKPWQKILSLFLIAGYVVLALLEKEGVVWRFLPIVFSAEISSMMYEVFSALILIGANIIIAKHLKLSQLSNMGKRTIIFCGSEAIIKNSFEMTRQKITALFGVDIVVNCIGTVLWCFVMLLAIYYAEKVLLCGGNKVIAGIKANKE